MPNVSFNNFAAFTSDEHILKGMWFGCEYVSLSPKLGSLWSLLSYGCLWDSITPDSIERHGNPLWYSCLENPWTEPGGLQYVGSQSRTWLMAHELSILIQCLCFCDWWCIMCQNVLPFLLLNSIPLYVTAACPDPFICYGRGLSPP